jgi:hypothetical protein
VAVKADIVVDWEKECVCVCVWGAGVSEGVTERVSAGVGAKNGPPAAAAAAAAEPAAAGTAVDEPAAAAAADAAAAAMASADVGDDDGPYADAPRPVPVPTPTPRPRATGGLRAYREPSGGTMAMDAVAAAAAAAAGPVADTYAADRPEASGMGGRPSLAVLAVSLASASPAADMRSSAQPVDGDDAREYGRLLRLRAELSEPPEPMTAAACVVAAPVLAYVPDGLVSAKSPGDPALTMAADGAARTVAAAAAANARGGGDAKARAEGGAAVSVVVRLRSGADGSRPLRCGVAMEQSSAQTPTRAVQQTLTGGCESSKLGRWWLRSGDEALCAARVGETRKPRSNRHEDHSTKDGTGKFEAYTREKTRSVLALKAQTILVDSGDFRIATRTRFPGGTARQMSSKQN